MKDKAAMEALSAMEGTEAFKQAQSMMSGPVRAPHTWTILQQDGPDHLGLWYNVLPEHKWP